MPPYRYRQTPPPTEGGPTSPEELAAQLGIDLSAMGSGSDPFDIFTEGASPDSQVGSGYIPPAPLGDNTRPQSRFTGDDSKTRGVTPQSILDTFGLGPEKDRDGGITYTSIAKLLKRFYQLSPDHIRRVQAMLYAGGFYGDVDVTDIRWGDHDEASFSAWAELLARTAKLNAAGQDVTYTDVLAQAATDAGIDLDILGDLFEEGSEEAIEDYLDRTTGEGDLIQITLSDPNSLRATMDQAASAVLGRRATPAEQQMLISAIHGIQRQGQAAMQGKPGLFAQQLEGDLSGNTDIPGSLGFGDEFPSGGGDTIIEYAPPDEAATAEALLREQNPGEAGAHDVANQVANLLQLLNAPVDVPRLTVG